MAKAGIIDYWFTQRGTGRESFDRARVVFSRVVVGAAQGCWQVVERTAPRGRVAFESDP
jgi:hypothetical protein